MICSKRHRLTHVHDLRTDVKLTKYIFDFALRRKGYENLTRLFNYRIKMKKKRRITRYKLN